MDRLSAGLLETLVSDCSSFPKLESFAPQMNPFSYAL